MSLQHGVPLRIGVLVDSRTVPQWISRLVAEVQRSSFLTLAYIAIARGESRRTRSGWGSRLIWSLYTAVDYRLHRARRDAFQEMELPSASASADLDAAPVDVVINLSEAEPAGLVEKATYGVWTLRFGRDRSWPPLFRELYEGEAVSESALTVFDRARNREIAIYRSWSATDMTSYYRSRNGTYWKTAEFVLRRLRDLGRDGWDRIVSDSQPIMPTDTVERTLPGAAVLIAFIVRLFLRRVVRRARRYRYRQQWRVAVRKKTWTTLASRDNRGFRFLVPPRDRFFADPFLFKYRGDHYVFVEDYRYRDKKAGISCARIGPDARPSQPEPVLLTEHHLSYPFVFELDGVVYLLPEASRARVLRLYRAVEFPRRWAFERDLMRDVHIADATLLRHAGKFWLFGMIPVEGTLDWDELHLFFADTLSGPWIPHSRNPIVSDVRSARPAGRLFWDGSALIRPSQDCSVRYGYALKFNRIDVLSETEYRETGVGEIRPEWTTGNLATHTIDHDDEIEVVDTQFAIARPLSDVVAVAARRLMTLRSGGRG